ncbi:hypothetical protein HNP93_001349 [Methanococcus maripaludis]|uniref:Uncharacterized protein n=1 Tax=Methanococcus maripaludis TaxID=39152 RepID=A0A7J9P7C3_METMI|nr:hypothetical protein [Methanococcus maripaludis]MBA2858648.1 hypothetical protein [Methanococcus maripaludis]
MENSDKKDSEDFKNVRNILNDAEKQISEKTGCPVLGIGITLDNGKYQTTINSGVYFGVIPKTDSYLKSQKDELNFEQASKYL